MSQMPKPNDYDQLPCWELMIEVADPHTVELVSTVHHAPQHIAEKVIRMLVSFMETASSRPELASMGGVALAWGRCHCHVRQVVQDPQGREMHTLERDAIKTPTGDMLGFRFTKDSVLSEPDGEGIPLWARGMEDEPVN